MPAEPGRDCPLCPRLVAFRGENRARYPDFRNAPVPSFGDPAARLLIVGLAPGLQGANRTGRPFTGDWAGDLLYETLLAFGFARGVYDERPDDGLELVDCLVTNAVRCVPPQNRPTPAEMATCRPFLAATIAGMPRLRAILVLGRVAHDSALRALALRPSVAPFAHGAATPLAARGGPALTLHASYHCSRYNTNTGVLTPAMFQAVFRALRAELDAARP
ncbi:MAG: uracil-DNA glycosylase [Methylobacteriaceae bacterium]|nr:uracil-DNA glycosylase [Methylobacteriaceae bacterium]